MKVLRGYIALSIALLGFLAGPAEALAEKLVLLVPDSGEQRELDLRATEAGELIIYLKSFGDLVSGFHVTIYDDQDRAVGRNISDMHGVVKFTNLPPGRFRIRVERKMNERGGVATVSIGDFKVRKIPRE